MKKTITVTIGLGTNLGDRLGNLATAIQRFSQKVTITGKSDVYETAPWGVMDQPNFLNQVVQGTTSLSPHELLRFLKEIEEDMGRIKTVRYGPRLIDLDILLYGEETISSVDLQIPHPRMCERAFVLVPLAEIAPDLIIPGQSKSVLKLMYGMDCSGVKQFNSTVENKVNMHPTSTKSVLEFGRKTYVMGILNVTPDSFSGDGLLSRADTIKAALEQAQRFVEAGADIIDIGGESTRPGAAPVNQQQEMDRVLPVIEALTRSGLETILSVDTYKAAVAEAAVTAGAQWINDVWGLHADPKMGAVAAKYQTPLILMHNRSKPSQVELQQRLGGHYIGAAYDDLLGDVKKELLESVALAKSAGVEDHQIILDPGIGFGKTVEQNLELVNRLNEIKALGYPVLLGPSRKSFIGYTLNLPPEDRVEGTAAVCAIGIARGADIIRVHDVEVMARVAKMTDALVR